MAINKPNVYKISEKGLGYALPHKMGNRLWGVMFVMAVMAFPVALILSWVRADALATAVGAADLERVARLEHIVTAVTFVGFMAVFAAVSFAIARILGRFRKGGGEVQEAVGREVHTLRMPVTAKAFMAFMMMGMMTLLVAVVLHLVVAVNVGAWAADSVARWGIVLEAVRRIGIGLYLFGITLGLGTVITVVRFQTARLAGLAATD